jgi:hypothetical protein
VRTAAVAVALLAAMICGAALCGAQPLAAVKAPPHITGWLSFGNGAARPGSTSAALDPQTLHADWFRATDGMVTTQPLVARNVPAAGEQTAYVATNAGRVIAYAPNGYVRWQRTLGALPNSCSQLDDWGVVGTPVIDPASRALYVADGFGLLHALDLVTGRDLPGWPVRIYDDPSAELVWGALASVDGSIYIGTGSYCDRPMVGKLIRVQVASKQVSSWTVVPPELGGGGSIWGWGGPAWSDARQALFVVTGNAFEGGTNTGAAFDEAAGYGEQLVEVSPDLHVLAASHPADVPGAGDFDFIGSPVIFTPPGCGELVAAANKNGRVYLWQSAAIANGPVVDLPVQATSPDQPLLTQLAYDPRTKSLYVSTFTSLIRVAVDGCESAHVAWRARYPSATLQGSPTIAGATVWVALSGAPAHLRGYDAATGRLRYDRSVGGISFAPPVALGGRLFESADHGFADRSARSEPAVAKAARPRAYTSWSDKRHGWQSRESGVYATDNGGRTWRRIYRTYAQRVVRLSTANGVISIGTGPVGCACREQQLWTADGGRTWHETQSLGPDFVGAGTNLYTWSGDALRRASWPPRRSAKLAVLAETIADAAPIPGGVAALLTESGHSWDNEARIAVLKGDTDSTLDLPDEPGRVLARALTVDWPTLVVRTYVFTDDGRRTVSWRSTDGGKSWHAA